ncbi:hypothetical protein Nepgr_002151 [Nepenthes gracilis]|uniref:Uncharacterized protein n=1 Tax=Nepenthes gracilis TaxID=150966 RepID=A0AAD3P6K4_NEPGR|nr:hypothetical protein Nepgr_002151 [Nepenthes gracilis]
MLRSDCFYNTGWTEDIRLVYFLHNEHADAPLFLVGTSIGENILYIKHLAYNTAKCGWDVVVSNYWGLGGVSITSDCFYNAGWTEDIRVVVCLLHNEHPDAPPFLVGTSVGANILSQVKYLGEDGDDIPIARAVSICSPWDLLIGDRFISRRLVQKFYDRALAIGLQDYTQLPQSRFSHLANWEGIKKVKYLGEDGGDIPIAGAVTICSPWDLLIGDRFISRGLVEKFYDRALAIGFQGYAQSYVLSSY